MQSQNQSRSSVQENLYLSPIPDTMNLRFVENHIIIERPVRAVYDWVTTWSNLPPGNIPDGRISWVATFITQAQDCSTLFCRQFQSIRRQGDESIGRHAVETPRTSSAAWSCSNRKSSPNYLQLHLTVNRAGAPIINSTVFISPDNFAVGLGIHRGPRRRSD